MTVGGFWTHSRRFIAAPTSGLRAVLRRLLAGFMAIAVVLGFFVSAPNAQAQVDPPAPESPAAVDAGDGGADQTAQDLLAQDTATPGPSDFAKAWRRGKTPRANDLPAFHAHLAPVSDIRFGGYGIMEATILRQKTPGARNLKTRNVQVTVRTPRGLRVSKVRAAGWKCRPAGRTSVCKTKSNKVIARQESPGRVPMRIATDGKRAKRLVGRSAPIRYTASWQQLRGGKWTTTTIKSKSMIEVDRKLGLQVKSASGPRMVGVRSDGDASVRRVSLTAEVSNLHNEQVRGTWTQVKGPKVTFLNAEGKSVGKQGAVVDVTGEVGQTVVIPKRVKKPTRFTFNFKASQRGAKVSKKVSVLVVPQVLGQFDPNTEQSIDRLFEQATARSMQVADAGAVSKLAAFKKGTISGPPVLRTGPGSRTAVTFDPGKQAVKNVSWSIDDAQPGALDSATPSGTQLVFDAPTTPASTVIVTARAELVDGSVVERSKIILVDPRLEDTVVNASTGQVRRVQYDSNGAVIVPASDPTDLSESVSPDPSSETTPPGAIDQTPTPSASSVTPEPSVSATPEPSASDEPGVGADGAGEPTPMVTGAPGTPNELAFCSLITQIQTAPGDITIAAKLGAVLTLKKATTTVPAAPQTCTSPNAAITFTDATLTHAGNSFTQLRGKITMDGVALTKGSFALPSSWQQYLPSAVALPIEAAADAPVRLPLIEGVWDAFDGQFTVSESGFSLEWLPLPGGWSFADRGFTITLTSANVPAPTLTPSPSGTSTPTPTPTPSPTDTQTPPARVDVAMVLVEQIAEANPDSGTGTALFSVGIVNGATNQINVDVAGIGIYSAANGNQLLANGSGTINVDERTGTVSLGLECVDQDNQSSPDCELVKGFFLRSGSLSWSNEVGQQGITFGADFEIRTGAPDVDSNNPNYEGQRTYQFAAEGRFSSTSDWQLSVSSDTPWQVSRNITLSGLAGSIGMTPVEGPNGTTSSKLLIGLRGQMDNAGMGERVTVKTVTANVTNMCTDENVANGTCVVGELRIDVVLAGTFTFKDRSPKDFLASATFNISTMKFVASASLSKMKFGPDNMNITDVGLTLTNASKDSGACQAKDAQTGPPPTNGWALAIQARGKAFGMTLDFGGQITLDKQYCVWATPAQTVNVADDVKVQDATFAYTSYPQGATVYVPQLGTPVGTEPKQIDVPGKKFKLSGSFELQADVASQIDDDPSSPTVGSKVEIQALLNSDLTGFEATVTYVVGKPVYFAGSANETNLTMRSVSLRMAVASTGISMSFSIGLNFHTIAGEDPVEQPASDTPLYGTIEVAFSTTKGPELSLMVGVDVSGGPVQNAFGQTGLTIKALSVAATLSAQPSFSFAGSVTFPADWVEKVQLREGATVSIGFVLSYTAPCIAFKLNGRAASDGINQYEVGFDLAGMGFLTAREFSFVIAPQTCKLPIGPGQWYEIPAGFGFWFDGEILSAPVTVGFNVKLPSPTSPGFAVKAALEIPALSVPGVTISGASGKDTPVLVDIDIDTQARRYYGKIDGSIEIGIGDSFDIASVKIFAEFDYDPTEKTLKLKFQGSSKLNFYVVRAQMSVDFTLNIEKGELKEFGVFADFDARIIGQRMYGGVGLYYNGDKLLTFNVYGGIKMWIIIGRFNGNFDINYCRGELTKPEDGPATCTMDATKKSVQFLVRIYGDIKIFGFKKDFNWKIVDKEIYDEAEVDGEIPFATDLSLTQEGLLRLADSKGIRQADGGKQGYAVKITGPAPEAFSVNGRTIEPCENMNSTLKFDPNNPEGDPIAAVVPKPGTCLMRGYLAVQNPDSNGGLDLNDASRFTKVEKLNMVCDSRGCAQFVPGGSERYPFYGFWTAGQGDTAPTGDVPTSVNAELTAAQRVAAQQAFFFAPGDAAMKPGTMPNGYEIRSTGSNRYSMLASPETNCKLWVEAGNKTNELISTCKNTRGNDVVMWQTGAGSTSTNGNYAVMQADGNFVFYQAGGAALWASGTFGSGNYVYLSDNGGLQVRSAQGKVLWAATTKSTTGNGVKPNSWSAGRVINIVTDRGKCLDAGGGMGSLAKIWDCNNTAPQRWTIVGDNTIKNEASGACLSVVGSGWESGTLIQLAACDSTNEGQQWAAFGSDRSLRNIGSGLCADVVNNNDANGTPLQVYDCKPGTAAQAFKVRDALVRGKEMTFTSLSTGRCLDLGGSVLTIWDCNNTKSQRFSITSNDQLKMDDGRCLGVMGNGSNGSLIQRQNCNNNSSGQRWTMAGNGGIRNMQTARCLDVTDNRNVNGNPVQLYDCKGNDPQKWSYRF